MNTGNKHGNEGLKKIIQKGVSLVDFTAPWCAPCRFQKPIIKQLAARYQKKARMVDLNVEEDQRLAMGFGITSIPTIIIFKDGKEIQRFVGLQPVEALSEAIDRVLNAGRKYHPQKIRGG